MTASESAPVRRRRYRRFDRRRLARRWRNCRLVGNRFDIGRRLVRRASTSASDRPLPVSPHRDQVRSSASANSSISANSAGASPDSAGVRHREPAVGSRHSHRRLRRCRGIRVSGLRGGRDQRDEADIGAASDPLQHHMADADRRFDAALPQRVVARFVEAGFSEIAKAEQRRAASLAPTTCRRGQTPRSAASMPCTSRCNRSTSGIARPAGSAATIRMPWMPSAKSSRAQPQVMSAPSGAPKPRSRSSRTAPVGGKPAGELCDLAAVRIRRPESLAASAAALAAPNSLAPTGLAHRILRAVGRPQPGGEHARCVHAPAADRRRLATGIPLFIAVI